MRNTWAIIKQYVFLNTFGAILREGISSRSISHNTHLRNNVLEFVCWVLNKEIIILYLCIRKLRKECNLLEMSVG